MKFSVSSFALLGKLSNAEPFISSNPAMPILDNFKFVVKDDLLTVTASDLQNTVVIYADVSADSDGSVCVPAKMLMDTLRNLPDLPVTFAINDDEQVVITSQVGKYKLTGEDAADYPNLQDVEGQMFDVNAHTFQDCVKQMVKFASSDDMKPNMNGVYFNVDTSGEMKFVATDGHRLSLYKVDSEYDFGSMEKSINCIIPRKSAGLLSRLKFSDTLTVSISESHISMTSNDITIISRLIDEKFPDYENVLPANSDKTLTVDSSSFLSSVKRIAIYANRSTNQVRFKPAEGALEVSAEDLDFANDATERMSADFTGEPIEIGFNSRFLIECLGVFKSGRVEIKMTEPNRAATITGLDDVDKGILMLVMPVMLNNYY